MVVTNRKIPLCYNKWDYFHLENTREQVLKRPLSTSKYVIFIIIFKKGERGLREQPKNQISKKALTAWKMGALISAGFWLLIVVAIGVGIYFLELSYWFLGLAAAVWVVYTIISVLVIPRVRHRVWRYEVHEHEIDLQFGLFVIKRVLIPMVRVQHVDTHQGPLLRRYKLASIEISTAATKHEIPALDLEEADLMRDHISKLARVTDDDV